ncbi:MAG: phosphatidate cytidylyltransferase [Pirellulaceae bacterium]
MLRWRLISALVILAVLCLLLWLDFHGPAGVWLGPLLLLLALAATQELLSMAAAGGWKPVGWSAYVGVLVVIAAAAVPAIWRSATAEVEVSPPTSLPDLTPDLSLLGGTMLGLIAAAALVVIGELLAFEKPDKVLANLAISILIVTLLAGSLSFLAALRFLGDGHWGMTALLTTVLVVKFSDTGQYAFGRLLGRHKLAPKVSPGKTIEGAVGGILTACLVAWLSLTFLAPLLVGPSEIKFAWWHGVTFGVWTALAGMVGDLSMSMIKRDVGRKDSSHWLPGLGGVLDVVDSILLAAPAAYLWWMLATAI